MGQGISGALQMLVNQKLETLQQDKERKAAMDQYEDLLKRGFDPKEAALWLQFTEGGKTHLAKEIVERMQREGQFERRGIPDRPQTGLELLEGEEEGGLARPEDMEREKPMLMFQELEKTEKPIGRTPKEKIAHQEKIEQRSFERSKNYLEKLTEIARDLPKEKLALSQMRGALEGGGFRKL